MWLKKWEKKVKIEERAAKKNCGAVELWRMLNFFFDTFSSSTATILPSLFVSM